MLSDLRFAVRSLSRSPAFTLAAVLILAIGIGAGAAMFGLVDAYYLRPLPGLVAPARLVDVEATEGGRVVGAMTYLDFADLRRQELVFADVMAYCPVVLDVGRGRETRRVPAAVVSTNYFAVLGAGTARGRSFVAGEEQPAHAHPVAIVSYRLWRTVFAADTGIVGSRVTLNGRDYTVVGVAASGFRGHLTSQAVDVWVPLSMAVEANPQGLVSLDNRSWPWLSVVARLAPGVSLPAAQAGANAVARQLEEAGAGDGRGDTAWRSSPLDDR